MTSKSRAFPAFPSAAAAVALGAFLWAGASPRVRAVVVEARPLGGPRSGLALSFSLQEDRFHQRQAAPGGTLEVVVDTLDAHTETTLVLDSEGRGTLLFPFDLARARARSLGVHLTATVVDGRDRIALPPGDLRLDPAPNEETAAPHFQLAPAGRTGPHTLYAHASQWPPPAEQPFIVQWRVEGLAGADLDECILQSTSDDGVTVERMPSTVPGLLRTRVFAPPFARNLAVALREPDGRESTWRGTLPSPPANMVVAVTRDHDDVHVQVRSNIPSAHYRLELADSAGLVADAPLVLAQTSDGFGAGEARIRSPASADPSWIVVREDGGSDVKVIAPLTGSDHALAVFEGLLRPRLDRWKAFDNFPEALRMAKRKRRLAMAGALAASFVGSLLTLAGLLARRKGEDANESLSIDGTRSVVDPTRARPLLFLLVGVLFAMVALAASLSDL